MTVQPNEQVPNNEQPQGHPAWQEVLSELPEEFHPLIADKLKDWDQRQQDKLQETRSQYENFDAYKPLVENNVPMDYIQQALFLAQNLEQNPEAVIEQAIEAYGLDFKKAQELQQAQQQQANGQQQEEEWDDDNPLKGLENHPAYQQLRQKLEEVDGYLNSQQQEQEEYEAQEALREELQALHEKHDIKDQNGNVLAGFDDLYVTALMAQGVDPEVAVNNFNETFNARLQAYTGAQQQQQPPRIMGGDGSTGSGVPAQPVKMGSLNKDSLNDLVNQIINSDS